MFIYISMIISTIFAVLDWPTKTESNSARGFIMPKMALQTVYSGSGFRGMTFGQVSSVLCRSKFIDVYRIGDNFPFGVKCIRDFGINVLKIILTLKRHILKSTSVV